MKTVKRIIYGAACVLLSVFAPYWLFAIMQNVDTSNAPPHYGITATAAAVSFALFCIFRLIKATKTRAGYFGTIASYLAFLLAAFAMSACDNPPGSIMIWPIVIPVGAVYLAPLVILNYIGSHLIINRK